MIRDQFILDLSGELIIDNFAGGAKVCKSERRTKGAMGDTE